MSKTSYGTRSRSLRISKRVNYYGRFLYNFVIIVVTLSFTCAFQFQPSRFELLEKPGDTVQYAIDIESDNSEPERIEFNLNTWTVNSINQITFEPYTGNWIELSDAQVTLNPEDEYTLEFTVSVPESGPEKWAEINLMASQLGSSFRIGRSVPVYLSLAHSVNYDVSVSDMIFEVTDEGLSVNVLVENRGNIHIRPTLIFSGQSRQGEDIDVPLVSDIPVYPQSSRWLTRHVVTELLPDLSHPYKLQLIYYDTKGNSIETIVK